MSLKGEESYQTAKGRPHRLHAGARVSRFGSRNGIGGSRIASGRPARLLLLALLVACAAAALLFLSPALRGSRTVVEAASPASGTIAPTGPVLPFTGTWAGTATGSGSAGEATCVEGVNCDTFRLTVAPGNYTGNIIAVRIQWTVAANDYDLYVHKCPTQASTNAQCNATAPVGQDGGGAPQTQENAAIDPGGVAATATDYTVHVVYFATSGPTDQYQGSVSLKAVTASRAANYVTGGINFSPSVTVKAPIAGRDGEPSIRTDVFGNTYVGGIRGVPAGNDLWYVDLRPTVSNAPNPNYDPFMRNWAYRGQPDSVTGDPVASAGAQGGGDIDLAVGFPDPTTGNLTEPATLAMSSLLLTNIPTQKSTDRGVTIQRNPAGSATSGVPIDDRQWNEFHGPNTVYMLYRTVAPTVTQILRSTDGGLVYNPPAQTAGAIGQVGYIDVHQKTGTVYVSGSTGQVCHSTVTLPTGEAAVYQCAQAATDPNGVAHIFFPVKVADDGTPNGTVYVAYSNDRDIFLVHSTDRGVTWSQPVRVSNGAGTKTSVFPWLETGPTPGSVGIVWYGTSAAANDDTANWQVFYAQSFNATSDTPTFRQVTVSDHFIHGSNISEGGLTGTANRNLIDYFQISFDPTGAAVVAYTDDHNDFDGHTYITRQISGPSIKDNAKTNVPSPGPTPAAQSGPAPLAATVGGIAGSQVTDFRGDVQTGAVGNVMADDPMDVVSISYTCETGPGGVPVVVAKMKVSDLAVVPPASNWRMSFTANAPFAGLSPTGDYSFALSDRGDQFWVRANTDTNPTGDFTWGTAVRNSDGSITYTQRGAADCGAFDTTNDTITIKVAVSKLNQFASKGAISNGSVIAGLRGSTFTSQANGKRDITRGGTEFTVGSCAAAPATGCAAAVDPTPTPTPTPTPSPTPTPTPPTTSAFQFDAAAYAVQEDCVPITVRVLRGGLTTTRATVDIASNDGTAKQKGDYQIVVGRLVFEAGETEKTFQVLINEDAYAEGAENATLVLQNPQNGTLGVPSSASLQIVDDTPEATSTNPIDESRNFVCQHYHDFLYRQSDQAGEDFWTGGIESCGGNAQCRVEKRVDVSTAFFLSIEFQTTGYFVIRTHKAAFGNEKFTPRYTVFLRDLRQISEGVIVGQPGFQQKLEENRQKYLEDFVTRPEFVSQFPVSMTAAQFVDKLFANTGATPTTAERNAAIAAYGSGNTAGRTAAVKSVADSDSVYGALYNPSFVLMQYFGYLRRNPDDSPDGNFAGYDFWLKKMNDFSVAGENVRDEAVALARVRRAEMVRAFIESFEYRRRFHGAPGGNQEGPSVPGDEGEVFLRYTLRVGPEVAKAGPVLFDPYFRRLWQLN
ncbi:MAG TPA: Calx-beta domain-containing protein [Pyrinomonadaceae bacterium]